MKQHRTQDNLHDKAREGANSPGTAMPFQAQIQKSFGGHDISDVRAHMNADATGSMGAEAYAYGNDVVFGSQPDMHTAAHEAAHTVQQKGGVNLAGGVGQEGDRYEQNADAVADAVVGGQSAESLLDPFGGGGGSSGAVQQKSVQMIPTADEIQNMTKEQCIELSGDIFAGRNEFASNGLMDHKVDAANDMRTDLGRSDPQSFGEKFALAALTVAVAAGSAALAVGMGPAGAAAVAGGAAIITALPGLFGGGEAIIDPTTFVSNYISALRQGWVSGVRALAGPMNTEASARTAATTLLSLSTTRVEFVKQTERNAILDAYVSATAEGRGEGTGGGAGMGDISYDDATQGRLHLHGMYFYSPNYELGKPRFMTMEGVGLEKLRNYNLDRKLDDIKCPRTMTVMTSWGLTSIGVNPGDGTSLEWANGMSETRAKWAMANYYHEREIDHDDMGYFEGDHEQELVDDNWDEGVNKVWDTIKGKTPREMGITSIGN